MILYKLFRHSHDFIQIKSSDALMREGDNGDEMYVLIDGEATIEYPCAQI
jgi:hypothetical protein